MTTYTDRTLPAPWEECDMCGKAAGLPTTAAPHLRTWPCAPRVPPGSR